MNKQSLPFMEGTEAGSLMSFADAGKWASQEFGRDIDASNIAYLVSYGWIPKIENGGGSTMVRLSDLQKYYSSWRNRREHHFKQRLGEDINWRLSFDQYRESETTKHVHRLHPYKGKFIPQLVEYFLDSHIDEFKTEQYFNPGDIVLDPFCGSGTTLVQANELGIHALGVDISEFNATIANLKLARADIVSLMRGADAVGQAIMRNPLGQTARICNVDVVASLRIFNEEYFPAQEFRRQVRLQEIDEANYGKTKATEYAPQFHQILDKHKVDMRPPGGTGFLDSWYCPAIRSEMNSAVEAIEQVSDKSTQEFLKIILSRTVRSARATTHSDLATLVAPIVQPYYCRKHRKICKPIFSMLGWWRRYAQGTISRIMDFDRLRTETHQLCLNGDARTTDLKKAVAEKNKKLASLIRKNGIRGIFSSPPYVGLIDYHDQHAYAYELFGLRRRDQEEIGPMSRGTGRSAREDYLESIAEVLRNCRRFLATDFNIFLVANDKTGLYPKIAERAGLQIVREYKRPVLNRAEGNKSAYGESIFHMREA